MTILYWLLVIAIALYWVNAAVWWCLRRRREKADGLRVARVTEQIAKKEMDDAVERDWDRLENERARDEQRAFEAREREIAREAKRRREQARRDSYDRLEVTVRERLERHHGILMEQATWESGPRPSHQSTMLGWLEDLYEEHRATLIERHGDPVVAKQVAAQERQERRAAEVESRRRERERLKAEKAWNEPVVINSFAPLSPPVITGSSIYTDCQRQRPWDAKMAKYGR